MRAGKVIGKFQARDTIEVVETLFNAHYNR
jgi:hypothetical protein